MAARPILLSTGIPDLQGQVNFSEWREMVQLRLSQYELQGFIDGTAIRPTKSAPDWEKEAHRRNKRAVFDLLYESTSPVRNQIQMASWNDNGKFDPKRLWEAAEKTINKLSVAESHHLIQELLRIDQQNYSDLQTYIDRFMHLVARLGGVGITFNDNVLRSVMLEGLKSFNSDWVLLLESHLELWTLTYHGLLNLVTAKANEQALGIAAANNRVLDHRQG